MLTVPEIEVLPLSWEAQGGGIYFKILERKGPQRASRVG